MGSKEHLAAKFFGYNEMFEVKTRGINRGCNPSRPRTNNEEIIEHNRRVSYNSGENKEFKKMGNDFILVRVHLDESLQHLHERVQQLVVS